MSQLAAERRGNPPAEAPDHGSAASSGKPKEPTRGAEDRISERLDRLDQNVGAAFSAYSGVLKLAVAALDKHAAEASPASEHSARPAPVRVGKLAG